MDGRAIFETFSATVADRINRAEPTREEMESPPLTREELRARYPWVYTADFTRPLPF